MIQKLIVVIKLQNAVNSKTIRLSALVVRWQNPCFDSFLDSQKMTNDVPNNETRNSTVKKFQSFCSFSEEVENV